MAWKAQSSEEIARSILQRCWLDQGKDVKVIDVNGDAIVCHRSILAMASPLLKEILKDLDGKETSLLMPDFTLEAISHFIDQCYCLYPKDSSSSVLDEVQSLVKQLKVQIMSVPLKAFEEYDIKQEIEDPIGVDERGEGHTISQDLGMGVTEDQEYLPDNVLVQVKEEPDETSDVNETNRIEECVSDIMNPLMVKKDLRSAKRSRKRPRTRESQDDPLSLNMSNSSEVKKLKDEELLGDQEDRAKPDAVKKTRKPKRNKAVPNKVMEQKKAGKGKDRQARKNCPECGILLSRSTLLSWHLNEHRGINPFSCDKCDAAFPSPPKLRSHKKAAHKADKTEWGVRSLCPICGVVLFTTQPLSHHMNEHKGIKPFKCKECDEAFPSSSQLNEHKKKMHTSWVTCDVCKELVKDKALHDENHHQPHLPYECKHCPFRGKIVGNIKRHMIRVHNDRSMIASKIQCEKCPAMVPRNKMTEHHNNCHDERLPVACKYCQYRGLSERSIINHMGNHHYELTTNKKKIKCSNNCGSTFTALSSLNEHLRRSCKFSKTKDKLLQEERKSGVYDIKQTKKNERLIAKRKKMRELRE